MPLSSQRLQMHKAVESQESARPVNPDARLLKKNGKTVGGYNCQIAVDDKHKLIVAEDVVQDGNDTARLEPMMTKAGEAMGTEGSTGLADSGSTALCLKGCEEGMDVYVPIPEQPACKGNGGQFGSDHFRYHAQDDTYVCPAGQRLVEANRPPRGASCISVYRSAAAICRECPLSGRMPGKGAVKPQSGALGACGRDRAASQEDERRFAMDARAAALVSIPSAHSSAGRGDHFQMRDWTGAAASSA